MKRKTFKNNRYKRLFLFLTAALSLLITGSIANNNLNTSNLLIITISGLCGVFLFYDVSYINQRENLKNKFRQFLKNKLKVFFSVVLIVLIPISYFILSKFSFVLFALTSFTGILYSQPFTINNTVVRLKKIFFVKNALIGISWGLLILIGAGSMENENVIILFYLASIQVFLGSVIRDLQDIEIDRKNSVNSLPVLFGLNRTLILMYLINLSALSLLALSNHSNELMYTILIIVTWRFINLIMVQKSNANLFWSQTFNLGTCFLFLIIISIQYSYGII